jgi:hypothetical protein
MRRTTAPCQDPVVLKLFALALLFSPAVRARWPQQTTELAWILQATSTILAPRVLPALCERDQLSQMYSLRPLPMRQRWQRR